MTWPDPRRIVLLLILSVFICLLSPIVLAADQETLIGVVLLHGKTGQPRVVGNGVAEPLRQAGFLVETPEMPWSRDRYIDKTYDDALNEIDQAIARLTAQGATRIVLAGHSMGADATLAYAARRGNIAAIILLAPGHIPDFPAFQRFAPDIQKAKTMIDAGQGEQTSTFGDANGGKEFTRTMKASVYYSFFRPDGIGAAAKNAASLSPAVPVLYVAGSTDPLTRSLGREFIFNKLPENPLTRYVIVDADHMGTPAAATGEMITWLKALTTQ
ncbi:MAG: alpha/beta fold hydrolase [Negativicutes bacterium]|nr:alpha/beta fold hydrolase [Negativicutes bacterium]